MRQHLSRTWYAFLARFPQPSPIQVEAVTPLLGGEAALLVSATASGKTEAFMAPLVERYYDDLKARVGHILLVCPTRALVNDAARRLETPLRACGLQLARRTGDASDNPAEQPAAVWITTPEGFDSLLCRHARWLGQTRAVVLDEIHVLENTPRGSQTLCLLERLDWVCRALQRPLPQRVAATATASSPQLLARAYLGDRALVVAPTANSRNLRLHYHKWFDFPTLRKELATLPDAGKVLLFASSRREAEEAAIELKGPPPFGNHVAVHHANLSRSLRLSTEKAFLKHSSALLCCTTTMEVGVDIGDVDWVVLLHPPENVLSFLQRAGRSGRRQGPAQVLAVFRQAAERVRYQYYLARSQAPADSTNGAAEIWHESVLPQQALSLLWQNPRKQISGSAFWERLPREFQQRHSPAEVDEMLDRLAGEDWLQANASGWTGGERLERLFRRGQLHSNIAGNQQKEVEVREAMTGRSLGKVQADRQGRVPARLRLAGRTHQLRQDFRQSGLVAAPAAPQGDEEASAYGPAAPTSLSSSQDFGHWLGLAPRCLLTHAGGSLYGHFLGSVWGEILRRHLEQNYPNALIYADAYVVAWQGGYVEEVWNEDALFGCAQKFGHVVRNKLSLGRWHARLPKSWQQQEILEVLQWNWVRSNWLTEPPRRVSGTEAEPLKQLLQREERLEIAGFFPIEAEDL